MKSTTRSVLALLAIGIGGCAAAQEPAEPAPDAGTSVDSGRLDTGTPATPDGAVDGGSPSDATSDATVEGGPAPDGGPDSATDGAPDASADATPEGGSPGDATPDATAHDAAADAAVAPPGATCANAPVTPLPVSATYTMDAAYGGDFAPDTAGCYFKAGPDRVFAFDVPAGKRLFSSVRGVGAFDPSIAIVDGASACPEGSTACLAASDVGLATSLNFVAVTNTGAASKRYFVVVDGPAETGQYDFRALTTDPLPGDTCAGASSITLTAGNANLAGETVDLYANDYTTGTGCSGFAGGERVYRIEVPANTNLAISVTPEATFDAALNVIEGAAGATPETACTGSVTCIGSANSGTAGAPERLVYRNNTAAARPIFVTVEAAVSTTTGNTFALAVETLPAVPGDTCADTPTVTFTGDTATVAGQSLLYALNDYGTGTGCVGTGGPERGYAVAIPAGKVLTVRATASPSTDGGASALNPAVNIVDGAACAAATRVCLRGSDSAGPTETLTFPNGGATTKNVVVFVETAASAVVAPGTFDVTFTLADPPPGETCATAALTAPGTYPNQTLLDFVNDYGFSSSCSGGSGPDRIYRVRVRPDERLTATVTPAVIDGSTNWDPSINLMTLTAGCVTTGRVCLAGRDGGGSGQPDSASWTNGTGADVDVYVAVETYTTLAPAAGAHRTYTLDVAVTLVGPPPPGDQCATATAVTPGTVADQSLLGFTNDYGTGTSCAYSSGADRVYSVSVPAGKRLKATVTPTTTDGGAAWDAVVNVQQAAGCVGTGRVCVAGANTGSSGAPDTVFWSNTGSAAAAVYVVVEAYSANDPTANAPYPFALTVALEDPPAGDTCSDTQAAITATTTLASESLLGVTRDITLSGATCSTFGGPTGPDRVYRVTLAPGKTLAVTVTPSIDLDPALAIIVGPASACTTPTCAAYADDGYDGDPETATWTNSGASPVDAFVVVGSYSFLTSYDYALAFVITP